MASLMQIAALVARFCDNGFRWGVVGSGAGHLAHAQDVLHTEADACLKAISQAQAWGMQNIHVETYSQLLVQALSNDQDLALNSVVFKDIKFQVRLNFPFFFPSFVLPSGM
jgi:ribonuclease HI